MFSTVKRHSQQTSQIEGPLEENKGKIKKKSGRVTASESSCNNNENCAALNVMHLVSGNSPTFRRNLTDSICNSQETTHPSRFRRSHRCENPQRPITNSDDARHYLVVIRFHRNQT